MALDKVLSTSIANGAVTAEAISNTANLVVGSISANGAELTSINATSISTGTLDTARLPATANIATAVNVGANVNLTTTGISVGNSTVNSSITSSSAGFGGNMSVVGTLAVANLDYSNSVPKFTVGDSQYGISSGGSQLHLHTLAGGVTVVNNGTYAGAILHTGNFTSSTVTSALGYTPVSRSNIYTTTVSLSGKSAGSWYDLIPTNALNSNTTYIVKVYWSHSTSGTPYLLTCSFLLNTIYSNGSGTGNSFTPICSTHVGGGYTFSFRGLFASGFVATGLQFSPSFTGDGNITVNCVLIG